MPLAFLEFRPSFVGGSTALRPNNMDGALVTKKFPIYRVAGHVIDPDFLSTLLRSRYYQRAFRAITTGHSNRRRTQAEDFEALELVYPTELDEQRRLISDIVGARLAQRRAAGDLHDELLRFSDLIDGRGNEELPEVLIDDGIDPEDE